MEGPRDSEWTEGKNETEEEPQLGDAALRTSKFDSIRFEFIYASLYVTETLDGMM